MSTRRLFCVFLRFCLFLFLALSCASLAQAQLPPSDCTRPANWTGQDDDSQGRDASGCIRDAMKRRYDFATIAGGYLQNTIRYYDHTDVYYYDYGRTRSYELNVPYCVKWKARGVSPLPTSQARFYVWASRSGSSSGIKRIGTVSTSGFTFKFSSAQRVYFSINTSYRGGHYGFSITRNKTCGTTYNSCPSRCSSNSDCASCQGKPKCDTRSRKCIADNNKCNATPGYYCLNTLKLSCGSAQYYCTGDGTRKKVSTGYYSTGGSSDRYRTGQKICEKGYYCSSGKRTKCPVGTTTSGTGATSQSQCRRTTCLARAGYYCSNGRSVPCGGAHYYCPGGVNATRRTTSRGYYSTGGTSSTRTGQRKCEAGYYCVSGIRSKCPTGTTSPAGAYAKSQCKASCKARAGYYCNNGKETACGGEQYYCKGGTDGKRSTVTKGYYSTGGTATTRTGQQICPPGTSCTSGKKTACEVGTHQPKSGQTACLPCPAGQYQDKVGQVACIQCKTGVCSAGQGECKTTGKWVCDAKKGASCDAKAGNPSKELCDGKDNDCDGQVDEDFPNENAPCTTGKGECKSSGKLVCKSDGSGRYCQARAIQPKKELCDGKDNDCDGSIDEDFGNKGKACTLGKGACKASGKYICKSNGSGVSCAAKVIQPSKEICDGKDNDCDGLTDEDGVCKEPTPEPSPEPATDGGTSDSGTSDTGSGDNGFTDGGVADSGVVDASPGDNGSTDGGSTDGASGDQGQTDKPVGGCSPACGDGEFCRKGQCVKVCGCLTCGKGQVCRDGQCVDDACATVECPEGKRCNSASGECRDDGCDKIKCKQGQVCRFGKCVADPCAGVQCPSDMICEEGNCFQSQCPEEPQKEVTTDAGNKDDKANDHGGKEDKTVDGGSKEKGSVGDGGAGDSTTNPETPGCSCTVAEQPLPLMTLLFVLCFFFLLRRRR